MATNVRDLSDFSGSVSTADFLPVDDATSGGGKITIAQLLALGGYGQILDDADSGYTYIGRAAVGVATSAESWDISRFEVSGDSVIVTHATGVAWDDRLTAVYA